jgi:hypothetical protein
MMIQFNKGLGLGRRQERERHGAAVAIGATCGGRLPPSRDWVAGGCTHVIYYEHT